MTVLQLKAMINHFPDDMEVIIQKDPEGNAYSPLSDLHRDGIYVPENAWSGGVYNVNETADEHCLEEGEWNEMKNQPRVLTLIPIN